MMQKKHAYLILAHNNFYNLEKLLLLLDDPRNDIYIHIDKKVKDFDFGYFGVLCQKSTLTFTKKRIDIGWAKPSMVRAELILFNAAVKRGSYHCYHLISGADLPLKSQDEIHRQCEQFSVNRLCYAPELTRWDWMRMNRYHNLFPGENRLSKKLNGWMYIIQEKLGVERLKRHGMKAYKGGQWGSFNHDAVMCLLKNEKKIRSMIRFTCCPDEVYKQVILMHNGHPVDPEDWRYLVNAGGSPSPVTFTAADFDSLIHQGDKLFARKFMADTDSQIIDRMFRYLMEQQKGAC